MFTKIGHAYKIAKYLTLLLIELPYMFNVTNSTQLISDLKNLKIDGSSRSASFDITNVCADIPTRELTTIIQNSLKTNLLDEQVITEMLMLRDIIVNQNFFVRNKALFTQTDGLAMGFPPSAVLSEICLKYIESNYIIELTLEHITRLFPIY